MGGAQRRLSAFAARRRWRFQEPLDLLHEHPLSDGQLARSHFASFGKMGPDKRYDRFGHIEGVEFSVEQNSWKERYVLNAAALFKLTGSRFLEYAGVKADAAFDKEPSDRHHVPGHRGAQGRSHSPAEREP